MMDFIEGDTLTNRIKNTNLNKDLKLITKISIDILNALSYIHTIPLVHRDLKPDNIMITRNNDIVKIIDFGLAQADWFDENMLKIGTPKYMAPEQNGNNKNIDYKADEQNGNKKDIDYKADIYSFGLILLEMLTKQTIDIELAKKHNEKLYNIIKKCTFVNKVDRYFSCNEIKKELELIDGFEVKNDKPQKQPNSVFGLIFSKDFIDRNIKFFWLFAISIFGILLGIYFKTDIQMWISMPLFGGLLIFALIYLFDKAIDENDKK